MKKKLTSLALSAALLFGLAACGGDNNDTSGSSNADSVANYLDGATLEYGRYVEEDITPDGMGRYIQTMRINGNDIDMISVDFGTFENDWAQTYLRHTSSDGGKTWQQASLDWMEQFVITPETDDDGFPLGTSRYINSLSLLEDGSIILIVYEYNYQDELSEYMYYTIAPDGTIKDFEFPIMDQFADQSQYSAYFSVLEPLENDLALIYISVSVYDPVDGYFYSNEETPQVKGVYNLTTGEEVFSIDDWNGWEYYTNGKILVLPTEQGEVRVLDAATGAPAAFDMPDNDLLTSIDTTSWYSYNNRTTKFDDNGMFYSAGRGGVQRMDATMAEPEMIMKSDRYTLGSALAAIESFSLLDDGSFIIGYSINEREAKLCRYYYDEEAVASSDITLKVYSLYYSLSVQQAISEFCQQYPEVNVEYEYYKDRFDFGWDDEENTLTTDDLLRNLSLEMLNGTGPDVLILDELPLQSYINQGALIDLSGLVSGLNLYDGVISSMYDGDKLYAVPTRFSVPVVFTSAGEAGRYTDLDTLLAGMATGEGAAAVPEYDFENMTEEDWEAYHQAMYGERDYEDRKILHFDSPDEVVKTLMQTSGPAVYTESTGINQESLSNLLEAANGIVQYLDLTNENAASYGWGYSTNSMGVSIMSYNTLDRFNQLQAHGGYINFSSIQYANEVANYQYWNQQDGLETREITMLAMPGLISGAYQPQIIAGVSSTSQKPDLAKALVAKLLDDSSVQNYDLGDGLPVSATAFEYQRQAYLEEMRQWQGKDVEMLDIDFASVFNSLTTPNYGEEYLLDVIQQHALGYFQGEQSLEQTVSDIVSETDLYFREKQQ